MNEHALLNFPPCSNFPLDETPAIANESRILLLVLSVTGN